MIKNLNTTVSILLLSLLILGAVPPTPIVGAVSVDSSSDNYVPGEVLVKFKPGISPTSLFLAKYNLSSPKKIIDPALHQKISKDIKSIGLDRWYKIKLTSSLSDPLTVAKALVLDSQVEHAEPNYIFKIQSSDPLFPNQWGLYNDQTYGGILPGVPGVLPQNQYSAHINAPGAWNFMGTGNTFNVAVIDTGIDYNHEDLKDRMWSGRGYDFVNNDNDPMDDNGHGTHVAGVIGAAHNGVGVMGVTNGARLAALKACDQNGLCSGDNIAQAVAYAVDRDFKVINASLGGSYINHLLVAGQLPSLSLFEAITVANDFGVLFTTSAGNLSIPGIVDAFDIDAVQYYPASYPLPNIITVTETDASDNRHGNFGALSVDLGAPGAGIFSTLPRNQNGVSQYGTRDGSSISTAFVTGAIALHWSYNQSINYLEIKDRVLQRTDKRLSLTGTTVSGGRLNVCRLFDAGGTNCTNPTLDIPNL